MPLYIGRAHPIERLDEDLDLTTAMRTTLPATKDWEVDFTPKQISAYYAALSHLLGRLDNSRTHYEALGVERSETLEQIKRAFLQAVYVLYPPYKMSATVPGNLQAKIESAFHRASTAFTVLGNFAKRVEYDEQILSSSQPAVVSTAPSQVSSPAAPVPRSDDQINHARLPSQRKAYSEFRVGVTAAAGAVQEDRRRLPRIRLSVPARVTGYDRQGGKWNEMATSIDVNRTGVTLQMRARVRPGCVLYLTLPMPAKLRNHGYTDAGYSVYCLVRHVEAPKQGIRNVGLEFLGQSPPAGFLDKPWAVFQTSSWAGANRRRKPRHIQSEMVVIEYFDESMQSVARETARTENLSHTGAQISVRTPPADFDLVRMLCPGRGFESFAALRSRFRGKDGYERLCLQFIDNEWKF